LCAVVVVIGLTSVRGVVRGDLVSP
jgi:hypothetical protein